MKPPFTLIQMHPSNDVVETLEYLLQEARGGQVIGIFYGVMLKRRAYFVDTAGEARRNPMFSLGMAHMLIGKLTDRVRGRGE